MLMNELSLLALYGLLVAATLVVQSIGAFRELGIGYMMSMRDDGQTVSGLAGRMDRALTNSITAMVLFAPAVLILGVKDGFSAATLLACQAFLLARIAYLPAYAFGLRTVRTAAWTIGFVATVALYLLGAFHS